MKTNLLITQLALAALTLMGVSFGANAQESINCLEWTYRAETQYVSNKAARRIANDIVADGAAFGFRIQSAVSGVDAELGPIRSFALKYDRDSFINNAKAIEAYSELMKSLAWHLNSRLGHAYFCSFWAPDPYPRLSGSN